MPTPEGTAIAEDLAKRANEASSRLATHGVPTKVNVDRGPMGHIAVEFHINAIFNIAVAEMLADHLDRKRDEA